MKNLLNMKAPSYDNITNTALKNLTSNCINYITNLTNSANFFHPPNPWKNPLFHVRIPKHDNNP